MRITLGIAAMASLCLLAGCNGGAANNSASAPAANAPAPAGTSEPVNAAASADRRRRQIRECISVMSGQLPAGTDPNAFCSCAIDKMLTNGTPQRDAIIQCAGEMHIQMQEG